MRWLDQIIFRFKSLFSKTQLDTELSEEIRSHVAMATEANIAKGMSPKEAHYAALREIGGLEQIKERTRDERGWVWVEHLIQDVRFGLRQLRKSPGFTFGAVLTLALGIGATATFFSVVNSVLLRPLAFPNADRLIYMQETYPPDGRLGAVSWASYYEWEDKAESFSGMAGFSPTRAGSLSVKGEIDRVSNLSVTTGFFDLLGVKPIIGRDFRSEEATPGNEAVMIIGHRYWTRKFFGRQDVLNQKAEFNGKVYTIVGVLPPNPQFDSSGMWVADVFVPMVTTAGLRSMRKGGHVQVVARLNPSVTPIEASAEMRVLSAAMAAEYPGTNAGRSVNITPLLDKVLASNFYGMSDIKPLLHILLGAAGFLLLLACVNIANMLLVRATVRQKEMAMRAALGASSGRIARQMLCEGLLLAGLGSVVGVLLGYASLALLKPLLGELPRGAEISLDGRVLVISGVVTLLVGLGFGFVTALQAAKIDIRQATQSGAGVGASRLSRRLRDSLVIVEVGLAFMLLVGAGLLCHSFVKLQRVDLGYRSDGVYAARLELPRNKYRSAAQQTEFARQLSEQLAQLPQVESVALTSGMPIYGSFSYEMTISEQAADPSRRKPRVMHSAVTSGYFRTLAIPMLRGRLFSGGDIEGSSRVAIISESVAEQFFHDRDPIGQRISFSNDPDVWLEIVGVVGDVKQWGPAYSFSAHATNVYVPFTQNPTPFNLMLAVRSGASADELPVIIRSVLHALDSGMNQPNISLLSDGVAASIGKYRLSFIVFAFFAGVALLLAAIGIYAVLSYGVSQRTREIGVRIALGARPGQVVLMVVRQAGIMVAFGMIAGCFGAWATASLLRSLLFGIGVYDPTAIVSGSVLLAVIALTACWLPARRAAKVDPMVALRIE